jgi:tRNA A-37 threonylcarbamoyl transferase component Bud32
MWIDTDLEDNGPYQSPIKKEIKLPIAIKYTILRKKKGRKYVTNFLKNLTDKPYITHKRPNNKILIYKKQNIVYKLITNPKQIFNEVGMQLLAKKYQSKCNIKIPKIFWWGKTQHIGIIAMELASGVILSKLDIDFKKQINHVDSRLNIYNIYHNDLNFSNIFYDKDIFWIIDFGEATTSPNRI